MEPQEAEDPNQFPEPGQATVSALHAGRHGDLAAWLHPVVEEAGRTVCGCDAVGVTVLAGDRLTNAVWKGELARRLDGAQCRAGQGPAWDAVRQLQVFNVSLPVEASCWPLFSRAAAATGTRSNLSVPLTLGGEVLGAVSLYSRRPGAFSGWEEAGLSVAARVAHVLVAARGKDRRPGTAHPRTREEVERAMHPAGGPLSAALSPTHGGRTQ